MIPNTLPSTSQSDAERAASPIVVVSDPLGTSQEVTPLRADTASSVTSAATATLRVRTDELKRSASSPQVNCINISVRMMFF